MNNNDNNENKIVYLRLDDIIPNRFQPREVFDETGLEELADSIKEHGVIQPIIVRQYGNKYELIAGERRSKASALAGLTTIPAIVRNMDDRESAKVSLLENLQRKNLSAIEEARTYKKILELDNMTQEDLAKTMGKSQPLIANKLRLLSLPEEVQEALIKNQISERHARSLLNVKDKQNQLMLLDKIRNERLTVRELDNEIKGINNMINENNSNTFNSEGVSYNNLGNLSSQQPIENYQNNFSNMGLNDYQSQINNSSFNNIPTNYQSNFDFNNNSFNSFSNINNDNQVSQDYDNQDTFKVNNSFQNEQFSNMTSQSDNYSSLGSMFDNKENNTTTVENSYVNETPKNENIFISQIKDDEIPKQTNQFLPNFDDIPNNDNTNFMYGGMEEKNLDYGMNSFNSFDNTGNLLENENSNQLQENNLDSFNYMNNANYDKPTIDTTEPITDFYNNQGGLFNQPLNIIDVPTNNKGNELSSIQIDNSLMSGETEETKFDNPFDDSYESILFAKPVPVQPVNESEEKNLEPISTININDDNSAITDETGNINNTLKNEYISLEPVKTIFDTRGAVLELKKTTDQIKKNNIKIDTEEIDYDDYYEIVIRIRKEQ